jgi:hypothetical protein
MTQKIAIPAGKIDDERFARYCTIRTRQYDLEDIYGPGKASTTVRKKQS